MAAVQTININCECHHRRGLLFLLRPWAWDRPCRRCSRMMSNNVIVVPTSGPAAVSVNATNGMYAAPMMGSTTSQGVPMPQPQLQPMLQPMPQPMPQSQLQPQPQYQPQPQVATAVRAQTSDDWQAYPTTLPPKYDTVAAY